MAVKEKVGADRSDMPANRLKLIHTGKVLKDDSTVEENGIKEGEFLVCMVTKDAPAPRPAAAAAAPAPAPAPTPTHVSAPAPAQSIPPSTGAAPPAQPAVEISPETVAMLTMMGNLSIAFNFALYYSYRINHKFRKVSPRLRRDTLLQLPGVTATSL